MNGIINFPLFIVSAVVLIIVPGPDFIYVTSRGISEGNKAGLISAIGISIGLLIHTLFAAFGLSVIIQTSRVAFMIVKYLGVAYLVYIGIKTIISKSKIVYIKRDKRVNNKKIFRQGILTNLFNPKAIITFMAFIPQFVDINIVHPIIQFTLLGIVLSLLAIIWFGFIGYFAGLIGGFIKRSNLFQNIIKYVSGTVMIGLGIRLVMQRK